MIRRIFRPGRVYGKAEPLTSTLSYNNHIVYYSQLLQKSLQPRVDGFKVLVGTLVERRRYAQSLG